MKPSESLFACAGAKASTPATAAAAITNTTFLMAFPILSSPEGEGTESFADAQTRVNGAFAARLRSNKQITSPVGAGCARNMRTFA